MSSSSPRSSWQPPSLAELQALLPAYEFLALIGRGGMGAVFKATQVSLNRPVAIKVLPASLMEDADANFAARFRQEALTMAKLTHPGIVRVFESGEAGGLLYIVMEFVDGTDVARMIAGEGKLAPELATKLLTQVCDALHYAHERGVVHRDIKPANLLLTRDGTVKIADFGLAKHDDAALLGLTKTNVAIGTPDFLAPEAWTPNTPLDGRADVYALGVTLYQMLTGEVPRGLWKMPSVKAGVDARFDAIIDRAMQPDRDARYQSSTELRLDLEKIQAEPDEDGTARAASGEVNDSPRSARLSTATVTALVGLAVILAVVSAALLWPRPPKQKTVAPPAPQKRLVTSAADSGPGSLRQAILDSPNGATITFATNLSGARITLTSGELVLNRNFIIDASALPGGLHINGNHASRIFNVAAQTVQVLDSLTLTNGATGESRGGGILNAGRLTVKRCTIAGNSAFSGGGIYSSGPLVVRQSLLWKNDAREGGGLRSENCELTLENSTFTGNTALTGGGLALSGSESVAVFAHVTIVSNMATVLDIGGGGISAAFFKEATLQNCIIAGNRGSPFADIRSDGAAFTSVGGNLIGNGSGFDRVPNAADQVGTEESPLVPKLAPLGQFGGATQTMPPMPDSPALDCGVSTSLTNDQRGWLRVVGPWPDAGAVEAEVPGNRPLVAKRPPVTHGITTTADEGAGSLRRALTDAHSGDIVTFATNLSGATILITNGTMDVKTSLTIDASALPGGITLDGNRRWTALQFFKSTTNVLNALTIANCVSLPLAGGGGILNYGRLTVNRCTLAGNSAGGGGAIWNEGDLTANQCTFTGNRSSKFGGGAIHNGAFSMTNATVQLNHCTLTGNQDTSDDGGGGIKSIGKVTLNNIIVAGNTPDNISGPFTATGVNFTEGNPALAPLGRYGGPTPTMPPLPGSPAIDAAIGSVFTTDQRGFPRSIGAAPDIGAVEYRRDK